MSSNFECIVWHDHTYIECHWVTAAVPTTLNLSTQVLITTSIYRMAGNF